MGRELFSLPVMASTPACDSALIPCLHGCLAFLHWHFPLQSPPSHLLSLSPTQSTAGLALGLLSNPYAPAPSKLVSLSWVGRAAAGIVHVILIPFSLSQSSLSTLQHSHMLLVCPKQLPRCGDLTPAFSSPPPGPLTRCRSSPSHPPLFSLLPSFCWVLRGSVYSFLVVNTPAHSQHVFCKICVWRCLPDASVERDVLHVHLLSHHLVSLTVILVLGEMEWVLFLEFPGHISQFSRTILIS